MMRLLIILFVVILVILSLYRILFTDTKSAPSNMNGKFWQIQSIDTMKYSRDLAREKLEVTDFQNVIDNQLKQIAETGATHVAIGTPYDEEFLPFLRRWVRTARKYHLHVWFRGNFSGWEEWFEYPAISRTEHSEKLKLFLEKNANLFENGDIFTSCPECENGGPGDPRMTGDIEGHRKFLIDEYVIAESAFRNMNINVIANLYSMNGDVALQVLDPDTTRKLNGVVTVDHYVENVDELIRDINMYKKSTGGSVMLGEWGAPIPDLHGKMTEEEQAQWIDDLLSRLVRETQIVGLNYWTNIGGSTEIWKANEEPKRAVDILNKYYNPPVISGKIINQWGQTVDMVYLNYLGNTNIVEYGTFRLPFFENATIKISKKGYVTTSYVVRSDTDISDVFLKLEKEDISATERIMIKFYDIFSNQETHSQ